MTKPTHPDTTPSSTDDAANESKDESKDESDDQREEREAEARRRAAEHTRKAAERAAESLKAQPGRKGKDKRQWYHWVIDITLFLVAAYLIKTRFFSNKDNMQPPAPPPSGSATAAGPADSAGPARVIVNPTQVLSGPGFHFAPVAALSAAVRAEIVEPPQGGWVKIRLGSSKEGFVPVEAIADTTRPKPKR